MKQILDFGKSFFTPFRLMLLAIMTIAIAIDHAFGSVVSGYSLAFAALAEDRSTEERVMQYRTYGVLASTKIYAGSMVAITAAGYAVPAADTAGLILVGRAEEQVDNSAGASGALSITVKRGTFSWAATGMSIANVGDPVFVLDDQTVDVTGGSTNKVFAGVIAEYVSATEVWVEQDATLDSYSHAAAAVAAVATADADATYGSPEQTLINELKAQFNALRTAMINSGILKP
ncbi:MAG: hypothetical protein Q8L88_02260 [Bacteroidota bacterium]|nr:hypothetical protein [Bacteroidota bacterium]